MSSRLRYSCEIGETQAPQGESGKITISETEPLEGKRSFEVPSTAPATEAHRASWTVASGTLPAGANNQNEYMRVYWYCKGDPSADVTLAAWGNLKEGRYGELIHLESGKLQLKRNGSTVIGETAAKVPVGMHYLEMRLLFGTSISNGQIEARLDGERFAVNNATNLGASLSHDELRIGVCNSAGGPGGLVQRIDCVALNDETGEKDTSWVGAFNASEPPAVVTGKADGIGGAIAALHGTINPKGLPTGYLFEYGTTKSYGSTTTEAEVGDGEKAVAIEVALKDLAPETAYHYRLVATNEIGESAGEDATFETGPGPSLDAVSAIFAADHETNDLSEYGSTGTLHGALSVVDSPPAYGGGLCLKAEVSDPDGYARGIATKAQTGWKSGEEVRWGGAFFLPKGFFAAKQGQIDVFRWDNFEQDEVTTERSGLVFSTSDTKLRLVRIKEGEPDEQVTLNLGSGEELLGPVITEGRWYWAEVRQVLWHEDALALNELWVDGAKVSSSTRRNCSRSDLVVSRYRVGIAATNGAQTNDITILVDRIRSGPMPLVGPLVTPNRTRVVERPPMRQYMLATTPSGKTYRWGEDEPNADRVFEDLQDSDSVPGGDKELSCSLPRKPHVDYGDMQRGTKIELIGAGRKLVWGGRLQQAPRTSGDKLVMDPAAVGYQDHLSDDESAQCIPIDADMSAWGEPSAARRAADKTIKLNQNAQVALLPAGDPKGSGSPAVSHSWAHIQNGTGAEYDVAESWYDSGGIELGRLMLDYLNVKGIGPGDTNWHTKPVAMEDDLFANSEVLKNFNGTSATAQNLAIAAQRFFIALQDYYTASLTSDGNWEDQWQNLRVFDRSGIPVYGTWPNVGVLFSDVLAYALSRWAPLINFTTGPMGSIRPTIFPIPHLSFKEPTTVMQMTEAGNRFELNEWAVWCRENGPTFYLNPRGEREGRKRWRVRCREVHLKDAGPSLANSVNGVIVQWQDVDGSAKFIGPPGSGLRLTDERLLDSDPLNPVNQIPGLRKWPKIAMKSKGSADGAIETAQRYIEQRKLLDTSGEATLPAIIEDEHGAKWPYYCAHSGDLLDPIDSSDPGYRYIVSAGRARGSRSNTVALDAPPDTREAMLERLDVEELAAGLA